MSAVLASTLCVVAGPSIAAQLPARRDTPRILVSAWLTNDSLSRVAADSVARALSTTHKTAQLLTISGRDVEATLHDHWYRVPGPLQLGDIWAVSKLTRPDVIIDVTAHADASGVALTPVRLQPARHVVDTLDTSRAPTLGAAASALATRLARDPNLRRP